MLEKLFSALFVLGLLAAAQPGTAQELSIRGGFSGSWYDPEQSGHGIEIDVIDPRRVVVTWYTFAPDGERIWLRGLGEIRGNTITADLNSHEGGRFPPDFDPAAVSATPWGEVVIEFDDCNSARMEWTTDRSGYEPGSMPLRRLTGIEGTRCGAAEAFQRSSSFGFEQGRGPWEAVFADYPVGDDLELQSQWSRIPEPLADRHGLMISGNNSSDDLAMFLKAPVKGLEPDTRYRVELEMTFATTVPRDCVGVGGSPGSGVHVKLGAAGVEPRQVVVREGGRDYYRLNVHKGIQSRGGRDAVVVGDMANFQEDCPPIAEREWQLKTVSTEGREFTATASADGTLWIYGGSDSAFEATTVYFVTDFTVRLSPAA